MKHIKTYEEFNGANLALNYNTNVDFITNQGKQFDGGDGNSATEIPRPFKHNVTNKITKFGIDTSDKKERIRKNKKYSKEAKIAKLMNYQTDDDLIKFAPRLEPTINA